MKLWPVISTMIFFSDDEGSYWQRKMFGHILTGHSIVLSSTINRPVAPDDKR